MQSSDKNDNIPLSKSQNIHIHPSMITHPAGTHQQIGVNNGPVEGLNKLKEENNSGNAGNSEENKKNMQNRYLVDEDDKENTHSFFNSTLREMNPLTTEKSKKIDQISLEEPSITLQNGTELFLDEDGMLTPKTPNSPKYKKINISQYMQENEAGGMEPKVQKSNPDIYGGIDKTPDYRTNNSELDMTSADVSELFEGGEMSKIRNKKEQCMGSQTVHRPEYSQSPQQPFFEKSGVEFKETKQKSCSEDVKLNTISKESKRNPNELQHSSNTTFKNQSDSFLRSFSVKISTSNLAEHQKIIMGSLDYSKSNIEESKPFFGKSSHLFYEPNPDTERLKELYLSKAARLEIRKDAIREFSKSKEKILNSRETQMRNEANQDFLVEEFLQNHQPKPVESLHGSKQGSAIKVKDDETGMKDIVSFTSFKKSAHDSLKKSGEQNITPRPSHEQINELQDKIGSQFSKKFSNEFKPSDDIDFTKTPNTSNISTYSDKNYQGSSTKSESNFKNFNILSKDPFVDFNSPPNLRISKKKYIDIEERQTAKFERLKKENLSMNKIIEESENSSVIGDYGKDVPKNVVTFNQSIQSPKNDNKPPPIYDEKRAIERADDESNIKEEPEEKKQIKTPSGKILTEFGTQTSNYFTDDNQGHKKKATMVVPEINDGRKNSPKNLPPKISNAVQSEKTVLFTSNEEQLEGLKALVRNKPIQTQNQRSSQKSTGSQKSMMHTSFSHQHFSVSTNFNNHFNSQNSNSPYFGTPNAQMLHINNYRLSNKSQHSASSIDRQSIVNRLNLPSSASYKNLGANKFNGMSIYNASCQSNMLSSTLNNSSLQFNIQSNKLLSKFFPPYSGNDIDFYSSFDKRGSNVSLIPRHLVKNFGPNCQEDSKFMYLAKECYLYSFLSHNLDQTGIEYIQIGIKVSIP